MRVPYIFFILLVIVAASVVLCGKAFAEDAPTTNSLAFVNTASAEKLNILEAVALNAAEATRTITIVPRRDWAKLRVWVFYTYSAATTVTTAMSCSLDTSQFGTPQTRAVTAGASTLSDLVDTKTTSAADQDYFFDFDVRGCRTVKLVFGGASADGSDLVNVQVAAITGV